MHDKHSNDEWKDVKVYFLSEKPKREMANQEFDFRGTGPSWLKNHFEFFDKEKLEETPATKVR